MNNKIQCELKLNILSFLKTFVEKSKSLICDWMILEIKQKVLRSESPPHR